MNTLYYGDCLTIMREKMQPESVDLVYLDPPFNSKRDYNAIYKDNTGRPLPDQVDAFTDTWTLDADRLRSIRELPRLLREHSVDGHSADFLAGFLSGLVHAQTDMAAYLAYMAERLLWIKRVMKPTASVYLHCDPTASHYLKIVMDVVFGRKNFRNEIVWRRIKGAKNDASQYGRSHDCLLYYSKSNRWIFVAPRLKTIDDSWYKKSDKIGKYVSRPLLAAGATGGDSGQPWRGIFPKGHWIVPQLLTKRYERECNKKLLGTVRERLDILADSGYIDFSRKGNPSWRRYLSEANPPRVDDIWDDKETRPIPRNSLERLDYPTQKPLALLERIIRASSKPGDVVFDPFCGCATTIEAAEALGRKWIGVDITIHAIRRVARARLQDRLHLAEGSDYVIDGVPQNWEGARQLWKQDPYQFQKWCVELVEGFVNVKQSADDGIDGRVYFDMPGEKVLQSMALEVKGGVNLSINHVRALNSVLQFENIQMAGLIALNAPGSQQAKNFQQTMALAGHLRIGEREYPKIQMLTVDEILAGANFEMPSPVGRTETRYDSDLFSRRQP